MERAKSITVFLLLLRLPPIAGSPKTSKDSRSRSWNEGITNSPPPRTSNSSQWATVQICRRVETYNEQFCVLTIAKQGYLLYFTTPPLLHLTPWKIRPPILDQIAFMLQKNVIFSVPPEIQGFYSNLFLLAPGGRIRHG